jgi:hypothetical protein
MSAPQHIATKTGGDLFYLSAPNLALGGKMFK